MNVAQLTPQQPKQLTLNERLNAAAGSLHAQHDRIQSMLARVNGTPLSGDAAGPTPTPAMLPMIGALEQIEDSIERICALTVNLERIA